MYLLDTNVISEMRLAALGRGNDNLMAWTKKQPKQLFYTHVVVLMEIERGILRLHRKDGKQAQVFDQWYQMVVRPTFKGRILPIGETTAAICASLHVPDRAPENDAWIAASAIEHNFTLVTRNTKDFQHKGLRVFNPFE